MSGEAAKAVFLSYASQDADAARRICEGLRTEGIEVWLDENALVGGDAWDEKIRRQIRDCVLFVPIVSANTQARREGYFRLEWKLADERTQLIAEGLPFVLPVVIDGIRERDALVPKSFLSVQWTWLSHGEVPTAFLVRVRKLLGAGDPAASGATTMETRVHVAPRRPRRIDLSRALPWGLAALLAGALVRTSVRPPMARSESPPAALSRAVIHTIIALPENAPLAPARSLPLGISYPSLALSPDGALVVYVALVGQTTHLYLRHLDQPDARPIPDTEGGYFPFFSPDGRWIGFLAHDKVKKVSVLGGAAVTLCDSGNEVHSAVWGTDNRIYFAPVYSLNRVPDAVGPVEILNRVFNTSGLEILPGAKHALASIGQFDALSSSGDYRPITRVSLTTNQTAVAIDRGHSPRFLPPSHIVYARGSGLFALPFDAERNLTLGEPVPVLERVMQDALGRVAQFAVSTSGSLIYAAGGSLDKTTPAWVDRNGRPSKLPMEPRTYGELRLSPDGNRVAILIPGVNDNIWVFDLETGKGAPLPETGVNRSPVWTPDGKRIIFASTRGSKIGVYARGTDGSHQNAELLYEAPKLTSFLETVMCSPDSKVLLVVAYLTSGAQELHALSLDGSRKTEKIPQSAKAWFTRFSPDGRWITYTSDQSGRSEVYVQPYPSGNQIQISFGGGEEAMWSAKGDELFFRNRDSWLVAPISHQPSFKACEPRELFRGPFLNVFGYSEDAHPDGQRFLMLMPEQPDTPVTHLHLVVNWVEEVKRRAPVAAERKSAK